MRASYLHYVTPKLCLRRRSQYKKSARTIGEVLDKCRHHPRRLVCREAVV
jgi:DNA gyrase/topoisomerase IV subunit A